MNRKKAQFSLRAAAQAAIFDERRLEHTLLVGPASATRQIAQEIAYEMDADFVEFSSATELAELDNILTDLSPKSIFYLPDGSNLDSLIQVALVLSVTKQKTQLVAGTSELHNILVADLSLAILKYTQKRNAQNVHVFIDGKYKGDFSTTNKNSFKTHPGSHNIKILRYY